MLTVADLDHAKENLDVIDAVVEQSSGTVATPDGGTIKCLQQAIADVGLLFQLATQGSSMNVLGSLGSAGNSAYVLTSDYVNTSGRVLTGFVEINWGSLRATNVAAGTNPLPLRAVNRSWNVTDNPEPADSSAYAQDVYFTNLSATLMNYQLRRMPSQRIPITIPVGKTWRTKVGVTTLTSTLGAKMTALELDGQQVFYFLK